MGTSADKLNYLIETKEAIKSALVGKGIEVSSTDTFRSYATKLEEASFGEGEGGGGSSKYGVSIDDILGDVDENGVLQEPSESFNAVFNGVKDVASNGSAFKFFNSNNIEKISFPDLVNLKNSSALRSIAYGSSSLKEVNIPNLITISGSAAMENAFRDCTSLTLVNIENLTDLNSSSGMTSIFRGCVSLKNISFPNVIYITGSHCLSYAFNGTSISEFPFPNLKEVRDEYVFYYGFEDCLSITNFSCPELEVINGSSAFSNLLGYGSNSSTNLETISFPKLKTVTGYYVFRQVACFKKKLKSVSFPKLEAVNGTTTIGKMFHQAFQSCTALESIDFSSLKSILGTAEFYMAFADCTSLTTISFPSLTDFGTTYINQLNDAFKYCTNLLEIHFRADTQATIEGLTGYSSKFGATNATIYFDL